METGQRLYEEAMAAGYMSPLPDVLRIALPNRKEVGGAGEWSMRFRQLKEELPGWIEPIDRLLASGGLDALARALDNYGGLIEAPNPDRVFRAFAEVPLTQVRVVFVGQDPYPTSGRSGDTLKIFNNFSHERVVEILGNGYENWEMVQGNPWPDGQCKDYARPRVQLGAIPYALGKSFGYPESCTDEPASYKNLRLGAQMCYPNRKLKMDKELNEWSRQGVLMLNACPILYKKGASETTLPPRSDSLGSRSHGYASAKNPNIWTAWTSEILSSIAKRNPYCVFVLLGKSATAYKKDIVSARAEACIIETGHPSSRSSSKGDFLNSGLFRRINEFFAAIADKCGNDPALAQIDW
jgi:uracil DNA glycosylase